MHISDLRLGAINLQLSSVNACMLWADGQANGQDGVNIIALRAEVGPDHT